MADKTGKVAAPTGKGEPTTRVVVKFQYEYIAVAGALNYEHGSWTGYVKHWGDANPGSAFMFVNQAFRKIQEYPDQAGARTLIVFQGDYPDEALVAFKNAAEKHKTRFIMVTGSAGLIHYINQRSESGHADLACKGSFCQAGERREDHPIKQLDIFSHGVVGSIEFGYDSDYQKAYALHAWHAAKLKEESFALDATIYSYACRTGLGNPAISSERDGRPLMQQASLAQKIANATKRPVMAYLRRSSYVDTISTKAEREFIAANQEPRIELRQPSAEVLEKRQQAAQLNGQIRKSQTKLGEGEFVFMPNGAREAVKAGNTPEGVPAGMVRYEPMKTPVDPAPAPQPEPASAK